MELVGVPQAMLEGWGAEVSGRPEPQAPHAVGHLLIKVTQSSRARGFQDEQNAHCSVSCGGPASAQSGAYTDSRCVLLTGLEAGSQNKGC